MQITSNPILFGEHPQDGLVAADLVQAKGKPDQMACFVRDGDATERVLEPFVSFVVVDEKRVKGYGVELTDCGVDFDRRDLDGRGALGVEMRFRSWRDCVAARRWLSAKTGMSAGAPMAPFIFINDPVRQHLTLTGRTLFSGMKFEDLKRLQLDIECVVSGGFEFCNAEREGDRIVAIGLSDQSGWTQVLSGAEMDERTLLESMVRIIQEKDPDIIEGHNIFNFDLPYIATRAKRLGVKLALGRGGSVPKVRPSRASIGDRSVNYSRFDIFGRHVVDTLYLVQAYDVADRSIEGFGLKNVAAHFGLSAENRTHIDGGDISSVFEEDPERLMKYLHDDVVETRSVSSLLLQSYFVQSQMLPFSCQNVCVRGNATKIDSLMIREYLRRGQAIARPGMARKFAGGYTDIFFEGVANCVQHCDVRSLYPTLMLTRELGPSSDELGVFLEMLSLLTKYRLATKKEMQDSCDEAERIRLGALQNTFKVLINSFYGYLGFAQGHFSDFDAAEKVTEAGRTLLKQMIATLKELGARPIEIDTDGIYFVPPWAEGDGGGKKKGDAKKFREAFASSLPRGIDVEFDGEYAAMYSYKMKNYALLGHDGEVLLKGAALRSRGLERFQRSFLRQLITLKLKGMDADIPSLKADYDRSLTEHEWPVTELAKTVTLQDAPAAYAAKVKKKGRGRDAAYELALRSNRTYRAGDQLTYYVTGTKKSVAAHENAKMASAWDADDRDENVAYYQAKLDALYKKFYDENASTDIQGTLSFG